jgi:MoaE-MoaD fusion protein
MRLASNQVEVSVRLFAQLRERAGTGELQLELPDGASVADALAELGTVTEGFPLVVAVNREYADKDHELAAGDELALIPPVSGGEATLVHARVTAEALDLVGVRAHVTNPAAGAVVVFEGVTRDVEALEYEAYAEMAEERMALILAEAVQRHGLTGAAAEHRVGIVPLSEPTVVVAVSAPHREEAFAGGRECIDRIKAEAPIWKKERDGGEDRWVDGELPPNGL